MNSTWQLSPQNSLNVICIHWLHFVKNMVNFMWIRTGEYDKKFGNFMREANDQLIIPILEW